MDPDPSIGAIWLAVLTLLAMIVRILRTALMSIDGGDDIDETIKKKEENIPCLQMGYNLLSAIFIAVSTIYLFKFLANCEFNKIIASVSGIFIMLVVLFVYDLLTSEIADRIASINPNKTLDVLNVAQIVIVALLKPIYFLYKLLRTGIIKLFRIPKPDPKVTVDQIRMLVEAGERQGILNAAEKGMIDGVMEFNETRAEEVMTPRTEVFMIDLNAASEEFLDDLISHRYSRVPVYDDDIDNIIGILYLKDFISEAYRKGFNNVDIKRLIKPAYFVPEWKNIHTLFQEMQRNQKHMAVLMDEFGGFSGILTMEDLTEEIMGELDDEYDDDEPEWYELTKNTAVIQGTTSIKDVNDMLGIDIPDDTEDYDTIAGFIINKLGYIPESKNVPLLEYKNLKIKILEVEDRRIKKLKIFITESCDSKLEDN